MSPLKPIKSAIFNSSTNYDKNTIYIFHILNASKFNKIIDLVKTIIEQICLAFFYLWKIVLVLN